MGGYIDSNGNEFDTKEEYYSNEKTTIKKEIKTEEARTNYQLADIDVMDTIDIALRKKGQKIGDYGVPVSIREEIAPSIDRLERTPLDNSARILAAEAGPKKESIYCIKNKSYIFSRFLSGQIGNFSALRRFFGSI